MIDVALLFPILSLCFIDVLYSNFISSSSSHNVECIFGIRNCRVTYSVDKNEFETCDNFQFYHLFTCAIYASSAMACLPVGLSTSTMSYKSACLRRIESATRFATLARLFNKPYCCSVAIYSQILVLWLQAITSINLRCYLFP